MFLTKTEKQEKVQKDIQELVRITEWSLNQIARHADLNTSTVTRLVNGQSIPSMETSVKLSALLRRMRRVENAARKIFKGREIQIEERKGD